MTVGNTAVNKGVAFIRYVWLDDLNLRSSSDLNLCFYGHNFYCPFDPPTGSSTSPNVKRLFQSSTDSFIPSCAGSAPVCQSPVKQGGLFSTSLARNTMQSARGWWTFKRD